MLDGQGADEQLAGYHGCYPYYLQGLRETGQYGQIARTLLERVLYQRIPLTPLVRDYALPLFPRPIAAELGAASLG